MGSFVEEYKLNHLARHAHEAASWHILFAQIEGQDLFVQQAERTQGFTRSTEDLERYVLPGTIALGDWDRFIRYSLVAVNLRGLAEALAEEGVLRALARQGQTALARSLAGQLPDPGRRAAARAVLAGEEQDAGLRAGLVREALDDLRALPIPWREGTLERLEAVARHLGPEIQQEWAGLAGRLEPGLRGRLWRAVADGCRRRGWEHPGVRRALREVGDPKLLRESLASWLAEGDVPAPSLLREIARGLPDPDGLLLWTALLTALGRTEWATPEDAWRAWEEQAGQGPPVPWTPELVEAGAGLFARLSSREARQLAASLGDPALQAAFHVARLERAPDGERTRAALETAGSVRTWGERLRWTLRLLGSWRGGAGERERLAAAVAHGLREGRYVAPAEDLGRFLDLAAEVFPRELSRLIGSVVRAPEQSPETLTALAERATAPAVLAGLFAEAEAYACIVAPTEAEAFELRARLLVRLACRLCRARGDVQPLEEAAGRLLPEERDDLYIAAARELADLVPAGELIEKIRSPSRQTATRLSLLGAAPAENGFDPRSLYESVAVVEPAEEERLALDLLAEPPLDAEALVEGPLAAMNSKERQGQALIDLALSALELEEGLFTKERRDPLAPLQLVRHSLSAVGSDERLAALTLELLGLARYMEGPRAVTEFHEAADVLAMRLESLPGPARREALEILLSRIQPVLLGRLAEMGRRRAAVRCRGVAELIDSILDLPAKIDDGPGRRALREGWHELLPAIFAAAERLPRLAWAFLAHPVRAWLWAQFLPEFSQLFGWDRMWKALGIPERIVPKRLRERLRTRWAAGEAQAFARDWDWLTPEQREILELCLAGREAWREEAVRLASAAGPCPRRVRALALLLSSADPERVPGLVSRLPQPEPDALAVRLIRGAWLPAAQAEDLLSSLSSPAHRGEAEAFGADGSSDEDRRARALGELAGRHGLDPSDPRAWPALRRLREEASEETSKALAESLVASLPDGGREGGERAFRVWLNSHLSPRSRQDGFKQRSARVRDAISHALIFPSSREAKTRPDAESASADAEGDPRAPREIYARWTRGRRLLPKRSDMPLYGRIGAGLALLLSVLSIFLDAPVREPLRPGLGIFLLHLAAWGGLVAHIRACAPQTRAAGISPRTLLVPTFLLLLPVPFVPLLGLFLYSRAIPTAAEETVVRRLRLSAGSADRLSRWRVLEEILRRSPARRKEPAPPRDLRDLGAFERRLLWLCNLKSAALFFDGAALAWMLHGVAEGRAWVRTGIDLTALAATFTGAGGLLIAAVRSRQHPPGERPGPLAPSAFGTYLGATQLAFAAGLSIGGPLREGDGWRVGGILAFAGACGGLISVGRIVADAFRKGKERTRSAVLWSLLFGYAGVVGLSMMREEESRETHLFLLRFCVAVCPWAVPLLALRQLLDALLRPHEPRDVLSREQPIAVRKSLAVRFLSVALPLGGLLVPAWSRLRRAPRERGESARGLPGS